MLKKLSNIQKDKLLHFFWGSILSFILILYFGIVGMIIALIIPAVKELYYDKYLGKGCCEWADYFYTIAANNNVGNYEISMTQFTVNAR